MRKPFLFIAFLLFLSSKSFSQNNSDSLQLAIDSAMHLLDDFIAAFDSTDKPESYIQTSVGIGNRTFSIHNNSLNSQQNTSTAVITPSVGYFHKSGISISGKVFLLNDIKKGFGINQYAVTPEYDLPENEKFDFGFSYTRYFVKDKYSPYSSPIQNDLYTSFAYKKYWLQPGIAVGYSSGEYKQTFYKDTTIGFIHKKLYDSMTSSLNAFSLIASVGHSFKWFDVFSKKDGIVFAPAIMLNTGSSKTTLTHKTNAPLLVNRLIMKGRLPKLQTTPFEMQSLGLSLDVNYSIGKFFIEPQFYLDYYLPKTDEEKFTQTFDVTIGFEF